MNFSSWGPIYITVHSHNQDVCILWFVVKHDLIWGEWSNSQLGIFIGPLPLLVAYITITHMPLVAGIWLLGNGQWTITAWIIMYMYFYTMHGRRWCMLELCTYLLFSPVPSHSPSFQFYMQKNRPLPIFLWVTLKNQQWPGDEATWHCCWLTWCGCPPWLHGGVKLIFTCHSSTLIFSKFICITE